MQNPFNPANTPLEAALAAYNAGKSVVKLAGNLNQQSLTEYTATTRLSPTVLIDKRVMVLDQAAVTSLLQSMLSIYSA